MSALQKGGRERGGSVGMGQNKEERGWEDNDHPAEGRQGGRSVGAGGGGGRVGEWKGRFPSPPISTPHLEKQRVCIPSAVLLL